MRLPYFERLEPGDLDEALEMLHAHGNDGGLLAGGTDLLVRMKQRLFTPKHLISLKKLTSLSYIREENGSLKIGAGTPLAEVSASSLVRERLPALFQAIQAIGAPTIQHHRGTIGGNLCQDNRCKFYNQSAFLRSTRQLCHKAGGKICYAREGSDRCRSTSQSDGAPALIALDARATLTSKQGARAIPLVDLYTTEGEHPLSIAPDELLTEIEIPTPKPGAGSSYKRISYRSAIDYPEVSAGVLVETDADAKINRARIVVGAIGGAPLLLAQASERLVGKSTADRDAMQKTADLAMDHASTFAVDNTHAALEYRISMISVMVRRALEEAGGKGKGK
ncbi:MAG: hypothetical protein GY859_24805 [Desulfobacterales bacterium]|nr:hypothetical protein [Desulfobacterales bacterium]